MRDERRFDHWSRLQCSDVEVVRAHMGPCGLAEHFHDKWSIGLILDGMCRFNSGERQYRVTPSEIFIIPPYEVHVCVGRHAGDSSAASEATSLGKRCPRETAAGEPHPSVKADQRTRGRRNAAEYRHAATGPRLRKRIPVVPPQAAPSFTGCLAPALGSGNRSGKNRTSNQIQPLACNSYLPAADRPFSAPVFAAVACIEGAPSAGTGQAAG